MTHDSELDPRSANVGFVWGVVAGDPDGDYNVGRIYYWYDPEGRLPKVDHWDFRAQHAEIDDVTWDRLFYEAFNRGETEFERKLLSDFPALLETAAGRTGFDIGRLFGPKLPPTV